MSLFSRIWRSCQSPSSASLRAAAARLDRNCRPDRFSGWRCCQTSRSRLQNARILTNSATGTSRRAPGSPLHPGQRRPQRSSKSRPENEDRNIDRLLLLNIFDRLLKSCSRRQWKLLPQNLLQHDLGVMSLQTFDDDASLVAFLSHVTGGGDEDTQSLLWHGRCPVAELSKSQNPRIEFVRCWYHSYWAQMGTIFSPG